MATQEQLGHDKLRVQVARMVEEALGLDEGGITAYFENVPEEDEVADGNADAWGELSWKSGADADDEEDAVYRVAASAVFGLSKSTETPEEGFKSVVASVRDVADKFEAARLLLQEKEATLD
jgi:hypothetical protein